MRARWPWPLARSQPSTCGRNRRDRSNFLLRMQYNQIAMLSLRSELRRKLLTFFYVNRNARVYVRKLALRGATIRRLRHVCSKA